MKLATMFRNILATHCCLVAFGLFPPVAFGQEARPAADGLPPLLDRELFFGEPEISGAQISPDGQYISFLKAYNGTRNIWVKGRSEPFDAARPITADTTRPISNYLWSRDGAFVLYVQDRGGDENFNVFAVRPDARPQPGANVPPARDLTGLTGVRTALYAAPKSDPDVLYIGLNDRDAAWHDLYRLTISTGERELMRTNTDRLVGWVFDLDGELRLGARSATDGDTEILRVDADGFTEIYRCGVLETCSPGRFHPDGQRVYMITNKGADVDLTRLVLIDLQSGREELVETDPERRVDLAAPIFSESTDELVGTVYVDDKPRVYWRDEEWEEDYQYLEQALGDKLVNFVSGTLDERLYLVGASADVEPGEVYLFDRQSNDLTLQYRIREELPREPLASTTPITYPSSDGLEIPAYLTLPKGVAPRGLPLVVVPHGGPWARDTWGYNGLVQFLANRGHAVLAPNFRGSTGYGKRFLDAGNREWGDKMQDDITWGVMHLVEEGIADRDRIGILGASYGGYATLAGVAFTPEVYAAAVSLVGPSNLITLLDAIPPYWEAVRTQFYVRMGDPRTPEGKAQLERQSPLNSTDEIATPLLVIQGANDPRVSKRESEQIVAALHERDSAVEYLLAPDEGHGFVTPVNNLAAFAAAEAFLAEHLGTRHQPSMTAEVAERLDRLTVDPATVEVPDAIGAEALPAPAPARELEAGTLRYRSRITMGGQDIEVPASVTIEDAGDTWIVVERATTPGGELEDRGVLAKPGLELMSRAVQQGPVTIDYEVEAGKAVGEMNVGTQTIPISVDLGGALFADGPGASAVIATLPLTDGYRTRLRGLNLQSQRIVRAAVEVLGRENVEVPAGSFEAFKVEVASEQAGNSTIWIATNSFRAVKSVTTGPQLNGAVVTSELLD